MANTQTTVPLFVSGAVLTAAQQNASAGTGVPVFATTVTRDAAFGGSNKALAEGQLCYIEASNIVQYYDGAAWATVGPSTAGGLVAITPTSVAVGSGSGSSSGNGLVTFSGASSISLNGVFSATYNNYRIILSPDAASTTLDVTVRLRISGTDVTTAASYQQENLSASDSTASASANTSQTSWYLLDNYNATYPFYAAATMELQRPFLTKKKTMISNVVNVTAAGSFRTLQRGHTQESTSACDGLSIICSSGNIGGTISVYGYAI